MEAYEVRPFGGPVDLDVRVPGSKSITNRALLLAALSDGVCTLHGCGWSEDSRVFTEALRSLGFDVQTGEPVTIRGESGRIPAKQAEVYVGSAGTAARFLTAMMALSDGMYEVSSSDQMKERPMRPLLEALEALGARFIFHEKCYAFPFRVEGAAGRDGAREESPEVPLNIDESSQFLSALLLCGPMVPGGFRIRLTGKREALSYVRITERMMRDFGFTPVEESEPGYYQVPPAAAYQAQDYAIEPDVSAACYFYAMAAANGGRARVRGVTRENSQGDMRFPELLEQMGCTVETLSPEGDICVCRAPEQPLRGIDVDMSDFSDQTMTLAAIAPFAEGPTTIRGVAHIRKQESDRIRGIVTELTRLGVSCEEYEDGLCIRPLGDISGKNETIHVQTYRDHRMAMAFAVTGTRLPGVVIDDPDCCRKTFEEFFSILSELTLAG